jgi:hypothetical protein
MDYQQWDRSLCNIEWSLLSRKKSVDDEVAVKKELHSDANVGPNSKLPEKTKG